MQIFSPYNMPDNLAHFVSQMPQPCNKNITVNFGGLGYGKKVFKFWFQSPSGRPSQDKISGQRLHQDRPPTQIRMHLLQVRGWQIPIMVGPIRTQTKLDAIWTLYVRTWPRQYTTLMATKLNNRLKFLRTFLCSFVKIRNLSHLESNCVEYLRT